MNLKNLNWGKKQTILFAGVNEFHKLDLYGSGVNLKVFNFNALNKYSFLKSIKDSLIFKIYFIVHFSS